MDSYVELCSEETDYCQITLRNSPVASNMPHNSDLCITCRCFTDYCTNHTLYLQSGSQHAQQHYSDIVCVCVCVFSIYLGTFRLDPILVSLE